MGSVMSLIDWCLDRKDHHNRIQQFEDKLLDYEYKIESIAENTADCLFDCCKQHK